MMFRVMCPLSRSTDKNDGCGSSLSWTSAMGQRWIHVLEKLAFGFALEKKIAAVKNRKTKAKPTGPHQRTMRVYNKKSYKFVHSNISAPILTSMLKSNRDIVATCVRFSMISCDGCEILKCFVCRATDVKGTALSAVPFRILIFREPVRCHRHENRATLKKAENGRNAAGEMVMWILVLILRIG